MQASASPRQILIAFCGFEGSGKNKAAEILNRQYFHSHSFAYSLKRMLAEVFCWDFELLEGITDESRKWREEVDPWWSKELDIPGLTPRMTLKLIGTDVMRNHFDNRIWVLSLRRRLMKLQQEQGCNVVITDCRFPSEATAVKASGGFVVRVERTEAEPEWLEDFYQFCAANVTRGDYTLVEDYADACGDLYYKKSGIHPAETSLLMYDKFDYTIDNKGALQQLEVEVDRMLTLLS